MRNKRKNGKKHKRTSNRKEETHETRGRGMKRHEKQEEETQENNVQEGSDT
jgi:hypothetical protein